MDHRRALSAAHYEELARIGHALGSPVRLRLIDLLRQGARSVEALAEQAHLPLANVSQHLQQLRAAHIVSTERQSQRIVYALRPRVSELFTDLRSLGAEVLPEMSQLSTALGVQTEATRAELIERVRLGTALLLDVRPLEEYKAGHLAGARSVPLSELRSRLDELPKNLLLVAYCRGPYCSLALEAVDILEHAGFEARHLDLGPPDFVTRKAIRVVTGEDAPSGPARRARRSPKKNRSRR